MAEDDSNGGALSTSKQIPTDVMGRIPILDSARVYTGWTAWLFNAFAYGAATWSLLAGGYAGAMLPPLQAVGGLILGQTLALLLCVLYTGVVCTRYGIDTVDAGRPAFGIRGAHIITALIMLVMLGSIIVLVAFTGAGIAQFLQQNLSVQPSAVAVGLISIVLVAIAVALASLGPQIFTDVWNWVVAPLFVVLVAVLLGLLFAHFGSELLWMQPANKYQTTHAEAFAFAVEAGAGTGFGYWVSTGTLFRLVDTPRKAIHGGLIGWAFLTIPVIGVAILSTVSLGTEDPTRWMYQLAGTIGGTLAIIFIVVANITSVVMMLYISGITMRQFQGLQKVPPRVMMTALSLPAIIAAFWPDQVFVIYPIFLGYVGLASGPVVAVLSTDYFLLRREKLDVRHIFTHKPGTKYWFWSGFNPAALAAVAIGIAFYLAIYNPLTGAHGSLFLWITASLPAFFVTGIAYLVLMWLFVLPRGIGDYPARTAHSNQYSTVDDSDLTL